jgi:hypothetical protein
MPKVNIDLGRDMEESMPTSISRDSVMYPTFHIETKKDIDFPHEGEMTIKFKKTGSSMSERDGDKHYSCAIEVRKIVGLYPKKNDETPEPRTADELDRLAAEVRKNRKSDEDY